MAYDSPECNFRYKVSSLEKVVDGDTIDVCIDLGFDVCTKQRVRLLGIDTPESRTSDKVEKVFGLISKQKLKEWCLKAVASEKDDVEIELRCPEADSRGSLDVYSLKFGFPRTVCGPMSINGYATEDTRCRMLVKTRQMLKSCTL